VRALLIVAAVATLAVLWIWIHDGQEGPVARGSGGPPLPAVPRLSEPASSAPVRKELGVPRSRGEVEAFLARCAERGEAAVPELLKRLSERRDVPFEPRWRFAGGRLKGYPTLRSAYLAALAAIPGDASADALRAVLAQNASVFEAYQIALALNDRGEAGWAKAALARAGERTSPKTLETQRAIVALAARLEPAATADQILAQAPRGEATTDPKALASALARLPAAEALATAEKLLLDPGITGRAKRRYLHSLFARPQLEQSVLLGVRAMLAGESLSRELRTEAAYAAAGAASFFSDAIAYQRALAQSKEEQAAAIQARCERRLAQVEALIDAAIGSDVNTSSDPRAASLKRMLERHRARLR